MIGNSFDSSVEQVLYQSVMDTLFERCTLICM